MTKEQIAVLKTRVKMSMELNEYLENNMGFCGLISWWGVNGLLKVWIKENVRLIEEWKDSES